VRLIVDFRLLRIIIIGVLIKCETRGPVFYSHLRVGKDGRHFKCYKFRTMVKDAEERLKELLQRDVNVKDEWEKHWKLKNDPRITKIGLFLRKTSLDELPQIFNVLKGDMSLTGPRPYLLRELPIVEDGMNTITKVVPGITGLWQVSGRSDTDYRYRIRLDIWYIMNWSLWLDVLILLKTIKVVILMKGVR
ncbi:MAG: sugar transferase, partial [Candidatus Magnetoovum sp. WYHC-5]|nr:sugar transferase [Candidatus Magnetoovum sp. WYHC-5]